VLAHPGLNLLHLAIYVVTAPDVTDDVERSFCMNFVRSQRTVAVDDTASANVPNERLDPRFRTLNAISLAKLARVKELESSSDPAVPRAAERRAGQKGQRVGSYTLIEPLGAGGMGEVWLAQHGLLDRLAAVKLIRPADSARHDGEQARKRFEREARATSALRSPHTIAIYDFGVTADLAFYYAMELLEGIGLDVLVDKFGKVAPARAIHLLRGACESLAEAHQRGVIHRDIKPSNVFTCTMGLSHDFVKVLDFGLVKQVVSTGALTSLTATGAIAGSPAFMPPESPRGEFTPKTDVYSLGCVAYWLLTGRFVFGGVTALEMMLAHSHAEAARPSTYLQQPLPSPLEDLIMACLAKTPDARPTIREVMDGLASMATEWPWRASDADAWWAEHHDELIGAHQVVGEAERDRLRGDALARRHRAALTPAERDVQVRAGLLRLQQHFLQSHLDMANLELRIQRVKQASGREEFDLVFSDLPELGLARVDDTGRAEEQALARPGMLALSRRANDIVCVMTHLIRRCTIEPDKEVRALCVMGYCTLDISGGSMALGVMRVNCTAVMGGLEVRVPHDVHVEIVSGGLMGSFEQQGTFSRDIPDGRTVIQLQGSAIMGLVVVRVRAR